MSKLTYANRCSSKSFPIQWDPQEKTPKVFSSVSKDPDLEALGIVMLEIEGMQPELKTEIKQILAMRDSHANTQ